MWIYLLYISGLWEFTTASSASGVLPTVYTIVEDDYGYMCACDCGDSTKRIAVCQYDKATACYCDI